MPANFYLESRADSKGDVRIRVSISIRGARFITTTGCKISPEKWDSRKQQVRRGCYSAVGVSYSSINASLLEILNHFTAYENTLPLRQRVTKEDIKAEFDNFMGRDKSKKCVVQKTMSEYIAEFISEMSELNEWTIGTIQKFAAMDRHLTDFDNKLTFANLTERKLTDYIAFLRDTEQMRNTTIKKHLSFLKWFLRWAAAKGYNTNTDYLAFAPKLKTTPKAVIFLNRQELFKVYNYNIPSNGTKVILHNFNGSEYTKEVHDAAAIAKSRDIFCFCCFTSLRYSDAVNLKWADINLENDSFTITTIKTNDTITIELNEYSSYVLDKYKAMRGQNKSSSSDYVFPHITNQRMNIYLKELCELCEINTPITETYFRGSRRYEEVKPKYALIGTHAGRRTFICNALSLGIPVNVVMKWTGHGDYKAMKPYIDIAEDIKAVSMKKMNGLL